METFIKLNKELLKRKDITSTQKLIISYLQSYQINNKYYFGGEPQLAEELGLSHPTLRDNIKALEKKKIIFKSQEDKYIQHTFQNRKCIVLVDSNNPYPTSNELSQQSNTNIPQEEIKPLKSNNNEIEKQVEMKAEELDKLLTERQNGDYNPTDVKNTIVEKPVVIIKNNFGDDVEVLEEYAEDYIQLIKGKKPSIEKRLKTYKNPSLLNNKLKEIIEQLKEREQYKFINNKELN